MHNKIWTSYHIQTFIFLSFVQRTVYFYILVIGTKDLKKKQTLTDDGKFLQF